MTDTKTKTDSDKIATLYARLGAPERGTKLKPVYLDNTTEGMRFLTYAVVGAAGMAGGGQNVTSESVQLYPGLNRVDGAVWARIEADAKRQREHGGGILSQTLDEHVTLIRDIDKTAPRTVAEVLARSADLSLIAELRDHSKHGPAARAAAKAWGSEHRSERVKIMRYMWGSSGGRKAV